MLDQYEVLGLVLALFGVIGGTIICLFFCFCSGKVQQTNIAMRYSNRYGRPVIVLEPTENGHTGLGQANGEFEFGIQQNPSILYAGMEYDFDSNYPGAAVPPPYTLQDNGAFHPPNYAKF